MGVSNRGLAPWQPNSSPWLRESSGKKARRRLSVCTACRVCKEWSRRGWSHTQTGHRQAYHAAAECPGLPSPANMSARCTAYPSCLTLST